MMRWLLLGYMFLFIERPFEVWPILGEFRLELCYMVLTLLVAIFASGKRWQPDRMHIALAAFAMAVLVSWLLGSWPEKTWPAVWDYCKILVFYGLIVTFVHSERDLRFLAMGFVAVMALYMSHSLREFIAGHHAFRMDVVRMIGVDESMSDPNSFGASILYALPIAAVFWTTGSGVGRRWLVAGYFALSVLCIALTGSRSAFVGLLLWAFLAIFRSRWRWRLALAAVAIAPLLWAALPGSLQDRFETIIYPESGPANALTSAQGRIQGLVNGLTLWQQNPLSGCGPGAWRPATQGDIESHNLYGQVLGETGTLGAIGFALMLWAFWVDVRWVGRVRSPSAGGRDDFLKALAGAIGISVLLLLFEGNFSHNLFRYTWVWYAGFLVSARSCAGQRLRRQPAEAIYPRARATIALEGEAQSSLAAVAGG
jgi:hypothetical protein